jgi:hypothetical protein
MKKTLMLMALVLVALPALAGGNPHKTPSGWFDMENCEFCRNLVADPELLDHCQWEVLPTADGMMTVMTVEPGYEASLAKASAAIEAFAAKLHSGQLDPTKVKMCGFCQAYGQLLAAGVKMETVNGKVAEVTLARSTDPNVIAQMHGIAKRNTEEMAIMMGGAADPHAGHKH